LLPTLRLAPSSRVGVLRAQAPATSVEQNVLLLDHLNINHEKGRHDLVSAFYFHLLGCAPDPRKAENLQKGRKTLWANLGITQFHLPEADRAQRWAGAVTLGYVSLAGVRERLAAPPQVLQGSLFSHAIDDGDSSISLTDPWGSSFRLVEMGAAARDPRGAQGGEPREEGRLVDLRCDVPAGSSLAGIGRFYAQVLGCAVEAIAGQVIVAMGPQQTLTFALADGRDASHDDLALTAEGEPCNLGPHVSLYLRDMAAAYERAHRLGVTYVNHRFKRRAYSREEAIEQCMFRILDVVDPEDVGAGPIVRLEHEVRSVTKADGSKYKSCPLDEVPV